VGSFLYTIHLIGPNGEETVEALVDTGATYTYLPRPMLERLGVQPTRTSRFALADGRIAEYELGWVRIRVDGQEDATLCIFGDADAEPLIGAFTLEEFLLGVDPVNQTLIPVVGRLKVVPSTSASK
jgi:clan AA aspartic protease